MRVAPEPFAVVIFGASGDLTRRKLFPALHNLNVQGFIPPNTCIVGTSRTQYSREEFLGEMRRAITTHSRLPPTHDWWESCSQEVY